MSGSLVIFCGLCVALVVGFVVLTSRPNPCPRCSARRGFRLMQPPELVERFNPELADESRFDDRAQAETFYGIQTYAECRACKGTVVRCG